MSCFINVMLEGHYAECFMLNVVMLIVFLLSVVMLNVVAPNYAILTELFLEFCQNASLC